MKNEMERMYVGIAEIQERYLPFSKKKIIAFIKKYVPYHKIGRSIYAEREALEAVLKSAEHREFSL